MRLESAVEGFQSTFCLREPDRLKPELRTLPPSPREERAEGGPGRGVSRPVRQPHPD